MFLTGTPDRPVRTLDCGCGNAYFSHQAVLRGARCLGITIHDWERQNCEEMRDYLGVPEERLEFRVASLDRARRRPRPARPVRPGAPARRDRAHHGRPHDVPADPRPARRRRLRLRHDPRPRLAGQRRRIRVTRVEDGWHVRNGYTFEQLEAVLEESGFEPIDRLRFGTLGSQPALAMRCVNQKRKRLWVSYWESSREHRCWRVPWSPFGWSARSTSTCAAEPGGAVGSCWPGPLA